MKEQPKIFKECTGFISTIFAGLLKDPDFKEYDRVYYKEKRIDQGLLDLLIEKYGFLVDYIKTYHIMNNSGKSYEEIEKYFKKNEKFTDDDMMYLIIYDGTYKKRLNESLKIIDTE